MTALLHRFLRYIAYDTRSNPDSLMRPSTAGQTVLLKTGIIRDVTKKTMEQCCHKI